MIQKYAPGTQYLNIEGSDLEILTKAIESGRMPGVTYGGHDPHYRGSISHMVNIVGLNRDWAVILDNNFIRDNQFVWMTPADFLQRAKSGQQLWAVILLHGGPSPDPWN
jgi:hypothetical protein